MLLPCHQMFHEVEPSGFLDIVCTIVLSISIIFVIVFLGLLLIAIVFLYIFYIRKIYNRRWSVAKSWLSIIRQQHISELIWLNGCIPTKKCDNQCWRNLGDLPSSILCCPFLKQLHVQLLGAHTPGGTQILSNADQPRHSRVKDCLQSSIAIVYCTAQIIAAATTLVEDKNFCRNVLLQRFNILRNPFES